MDIRLAGNASLIFTRGCPAGALAIVANAADEYSSRTMRVINGAPAARFVRTQPLLPPRPLNAAIQGADSLSRMLGEPPAFR